MKAMYSIHYDYIELTAYGKLSNAMLPFLGEDHVADVANKVEACIKITPIPRCGPGDC